MGDPQPCPVCGAFMVPDDYTGFQWNGMEFFVECPDGCYAWHFAYGRYQEFVGDRSWQWMYDSPPREILRTRSEVRDAIEASPRVF